MLGAILLLTGAVIIARLVFAGLDLYDEHKALVDAHPEVVPQCPEL